MTRFWITFDSSDELVTRYSLMLGAGVTAFDETDAIEVLRKTLDAKRLPSIESIAADVRFDDLQRQVQRDVGNMAVRSVWYPCFNL